MLRFNNKINKGINSYNRHMLNPILCHLPLNKIKLFGKFTKK